MAPAEAPPALGRRVRVRACAHTTPQSAVGEGGGLVPLRALEMWPPTPLGPDWLWRIEDQLASAASLFVCLVVVLSPIMALCLAVQCVNCIQDRRRRRRWAALGYTWIPDEGTIATTTTSSSRHEPRPRVGPEPAPPAAPPARRDEAAIAEPPPPGRYHINSYFDRVYESP